MQTATVQFIYWVTDADPATVTSQQLVKIPNAQ